MFHHLSRIACILVVLTILFAGKAYSQELDVTFLKQSGNPGDTISFDASFNINNQPVATGSLFLKIVNEEGKIWNMRWPVLNGICQADIVIPDSFPKADLTFYFAATTRFFVVYGKLKSGGKIKMLKSTLMTSSKEWVLEDIKVTDDGSFVYRNKVFEGYATLFLKREKGNSDDLDIGIVSLLDSSFTPHAVVTKKVSIGKPLDTTSAPINALSFEKVDSAVDSKGKMLETVVVTAKKQTRAQQFNEKYSKGLFNSINERIFDLMDDPVAATSFDVLNYLSGRVAGLMIRNPIGADATATWRGDPVTFYIDEMRVDIPAVRMLSVNDIAIVKTYPPPFFGNTFGEGGAVAIYTKRGEYNGNSNRRNFRVKGYTPFTTSLPINPAE